MSFQTFVCQTGWKYKVSKEARKGMMASEICKPTSEGKYIKDTVFDRRWATASIDEFHEFRTQSTGYFGLMALQAKNADFIIGATATPLFNSYQVSPWDRCGVTAVSFGYGIPY
jgi:hypothetical protein